ncbi:MAG: hypothetical protein WKF89_07890 [Chitinophagaceae bacterium]
MIEVFKTNVPDSRQANLLLEKIHKSFMSYKANFDLEDCDKILRVKSSDGIVDPDCLINFLKDFGFHAEVLTEENYTVLQQLPN